MYFVKDYQQSKPVNFDEIRAKNEKLKADSQGSYIQYEDGSILKILPE